ncbi:glycosyltransferase family 9 protein [bacterium]|nr:MAG: glycosyltransferase family 9 protein [bacterium]
MKRDSELRFARFLDSLLGNLLLRTAPLLLPSPKKARPVADEVKNILLIKFHGIGNIVMILPALRALRKRFPGARIDFLTLDTNKGILAGTKGLHESHFLASDTIVDFLFSMKKTLPVLKAANYDLIIDFEQFANISTLISALLGAPERVGFAAHGPSRVKVYTKAVPYEETAHMWRIFMRLAETAGASPDNPEREIDLTDSHMAEAAALEKEAGISPSDVMVVMHPGSSSNLPIRRWPSERFGYLSAQLFREFGAKTLVTGIPGEKSIIDDVVAASESTAFNAAGKLSVKGLAALCRRAELVVSNDTATVHIASAMGTPVVGLFGPNTPFLYGPVGKSDVVFYTKPHCSPCLTNTNRKLSGCRKPDCMLAIEPETVFSAIKREYFPSGKLISGPFKKNRDLTTGGASPEGAQV